ncbi:hypothetical protein HOLleu_30912 [Holothuria leucospilota]|uniref:Peptidase aspartic putative domain-containing protein n=1 Tax=Holothuria leucospilota TaxID=206669 RepID=A0A9Q1H085_HOLLE|nr:hypothetical protein HOLleu_30912 [Holothuria leucospilota]
MVGKQNTPPTEGEFPENAGSTDNGSQRTNNSTYTGTYMSKGNEIALRTVPVIISNGSKEVKVNALLDDGSSQKYVNSNLCGELGLHGEMQEIVVSTLNGREERFTTQPVDIYVSPLHNSRRYKISLTTNNATGNLKPTQWARLSKDWEHLQDIDFPETTNKRHGVDVLIGVDNSELHTSIEERRGSPGEPVARLTPLGWTCVGPVTKNSRIIAGRTSLYANTFRCSEITDSTCEIIKRFWEVETVGLGKKKQNATLLRKRGPKKLCQMQ